MGCSGRVKAEEIRADQKWDFISLSDFKSANCLSGFAYVYLLGSLLVSVAVYGVDTFTAVNLLVFDRWSGKIDPAISLKISKWIFSACIIASWVNLGYEYVRALRVIKRGAVAESYLDSLAVRIQCIRWTKTGRGWRRFLVFAELTKSKKGAEYVALFTYFSFQAWIRIIFCQGPRQVVNAITLKAVFESKLIPTDGSNVGSAIGEFFEKIGQLAKEDNQQAVILSGMLFTLVIWVFGALSLILAVLFYILFLWHYIPNGDGGLSGYCEKKINKRLAAIVSVKVNKAIEEEERKRRKEDAKAFKKGEQPSFGRQATLPTLFDPKEPKESDRLPQMPMLNRNDTMATLPAYTSRPGTPGGPALTATFEMNDLDSKRPAPGRNLTNSSFASNAPLISNASDMGYDNLDSPASGFPRDRPGFPAPIRTMTASSQRSQWSANSRTPIDDRGYTASPVSYDNNRPPLPPHMSNVSSSSHGSVDNYGRPMPRPNDRSFTPVGPAPSMGRRTPFGENTPTDRSSPAPFGSEYGESGSFPPPRGPGSEFGRNSPAPYGSDVGGPMPSRGAPSEFGRNSPAPSAMDRRPVPPSNGYQAFNPNNRSASSANAAPYPTSSRPGPQQRNVTDPGRGQQDYFGDARPGTSQSNRPPPGRAPTQDSFGGPRPGTAQSNRPAPSNFNRGPMQDQYGEFRPGTSQSNRPQYDPNPSIGQGQNYYGEEAPVSHQGQRLPPPSRDAAASPGAYSQGGNRMPGGFDDRQGYTR